MTTAPDMAAPPRPTAPDTPDPALINTCVHCGFCLPTCPTYVLDHEEMDSPRGRIYLMRAVQEGRAEITDAYVRHFDRCLGCVGCVTACPSGVQYGTLVETARSQIERTYTRPLGDRLFRGLVFALFPYPARLRVALLPLVVYRRIAPWVERSGLTALLPKRVRAMLSVAPPVTVSGLMARTPVRTPAVAPRRLTVGLLTGCVQRLAFPGVNDATRRVLAADGCDVVAPGGQSCCGALSLHAGRLDEAREAARRTIATFESAGVERVVSNAAGCGSAMKEYAHLLKDDAAWAERARRFSASVRDISECLTELGPAATRHPIDARVVYHDACHLAHAQGVRRQPRDMLATIPGLTVVTPPDADLCCGSAGIYNLLESDAANALGDRKAAALASTRVDVIASANPGCSLQIAAAARRRGAVWTVVHPIEIVDASIRGSALPDHSPR